MCAPEQVERQRRALLLAARVVEASRRRRARTSSPLRTIRWSSVTCNLAVVLEPRLATLSSFSFSSTTSNSGTDSAASSRSPQAVGVRLWLRRALRLKLRPRLKHRSRLELQRVAARLLEALEHVRLLQALRRMKENSIERGW